MSQAHTWDDIFKLPENRICQHSILQKAKDQSPSEFHGEEDKKKKLVHGQWDIRAYLIDADVFFLIRDITCMLGHLI